MKDVGVLILLSTFMIAGGEYLGHQDDMKVGVRSMMEDDLDELATVEGVVILLSTFMIAGGEYLRHRDDLVSMMEDNLDEVETASEAYIYFYPIVVNTVTLFENSIWPHVDRGYSPVNTFKPSHMLDWTVPTYSEPSVDTMYTRAWLDLEKYPIVLNIPDIDHHRYYCVSFFDGFNVIFKVISPRTRGGSWEADQYIIVGPGFRGSLPSHFDDDHTIRSLSRFTYIIVRIEVYGPDDASNVERIQNGHTLASLDGNEPPKTSIPIFPFLERKQLVGNIPEPQVFFSCANFIINYMEIGDEESDLFKRFAKIEVGPSREFIGQEMSQQMYKNIQDGIADGSKKINDASTPDVIVNGWFLISAEGMHDSYLGRAVCAKVGSVYGSDAEEGVYYYNRGGMEPLDSTKYDYTLTFLPGQFPPVMEQYGGFWSVTVYLGSPGPGTLVHNPIDRYMINGKATPGLVYDAYGALTLYIQKTRPNTDAQAANWLPTPDPEFGGYETGEFHLLMRYYMPEDTDYYPPSVVEAGPAT